MKPTYSVIPGSAGGQHWLARFVDHQETFAPHIIQAFVERVPTLETVVDLGAGSGRDLGIVQAIHPHATEIAIELGQPHISLLQPKVNQVIRLNIETDALPIADESVDLVIANQILEHTKEIFWIFHELSRSLKLGGHLIIGVPNIASLHNRLLLLFGQHPTQWKLHSAHVRPFSKPGTLAFLDVCFPGGYSLEAFAGSQFYPFPPKLSRPLSTLFPSLSFSIFFLFKKISPYHNQFIDFPLQARLETNFYTGTPHSSDQTV